MTFVLPAYFFCLHCSTKFSATTYMPQTEEDDIKTYRWKAIPTESQRFPPDADLIGFFSDITNRRLAMWS